MSTLLNKAAILGAADLKTEDVPMAEWGGTVRITSMTGQARDEFYQSINADGPAPPGVFAAALVIATCVDANGNRIFSMADMPALQAKSAASLDVPAAVAMRLNGLGVKAVDDAAKNSASGQSDDSGSGSPKS